MTPAAQQIAIAEACGWSRIERSPRGRGPQGYHVARYGVNRMSVPNYPRDLNAMHEAEKVLIARGGWATYEHCLEDNARREDGQPWYGVAYASAAQRAEAFLRTLGKWTDEAANPV